MSKCLNTYVYYNMFKYLLIKVILIKNLTKWALTFILLLSKIIVNIVLYQFENSDFKVKGQTRFQVYWFHFVPLFYIFHQLENYDPMFMVRFVVP